MNFIRNLPYWITDFVLQRDVRQVLSDCLRTFKKLSKSTGNGMLSRFGIESLKTDVQDDVEIPPSLPEKYRRVIEAHYHALLSYRPGVYPGRLTLFRTKAQPLFRAFGSDNGWSRLVGGGVEVYNVNGNHLNFMQEPYVRSLAQQLLVALTLSM
jgi:thioesterase domain-containing protein